MENSSRESRLSKRLRNDIFTEATCPRLAIAPERNRLNGFIESASSPLLRWFKKLCCSPQYCCDND